VIVRRAHELERRSRTGDLFIGAHEYRPLVGTESRQFRVSELTFADGARTRLHVHDSEQVVVVTAGEGIVATPDAEHALSAGDIAIIPAEEPHWHGAPPRGTVTQISILGGPHTTRLV
jgi:quercetin dioxygenase-like cupin family protein